MKKRIISVILMMLLCLTCFSVSVFAEDSSAPQTEKDAESLVEQARALIDAEEYEAAIPILEEAAKLGNAEAQNSLGSCYLFGEGVEQDYEKAVEYYLLAADQGYVDALYNLGCCYYDGQGVEQDYEKAVEYFLLAADQGLVYAVYGLGCCYYYGEGVEQDYGKAVEYFCPAADQGHDLSQSAMGYCYEYGQGVDQDYDEAIKYYKLAAEQGIPDAVFGIGDCYYAKEDWKAAAEWYQKALDAGYEPDKEEKGRIEEAKKQIAAQAAAKSSDTGEKNNIWIVLALALVCVVGLTGLSRKREG